MREAAATAQRGAPQKMRGANGAAHGNKRQIDQPSTFQLRTLYFLNQATIWFQASSAASLR